MRIRDHCVAILGTMSLAAACHEPTSESAASGVPAFSVADAAACPTPADFVVSDEAGLHAAVGGWSLPGQVIGVSGIIAVSRDLYVFKRGITLTCATAGAGLTAQPGVTVILHVFGDSVTVDRLVLDASDAPGAGVFWAEAATGVRFTNNRVTCGSVDCGFFQGTPAAVVADNQFVSHGSVSGVHLQLNQHTGTLIDNSRVERNTIVATAPSTGPNFGGIRARDGSGVTIAHNVVLGPWRNSMSLVNLAGSLVEHNRLEGAELYGILTRSSTSPPPGPVSIFNNLFRANRVGGAGSAGIFLQWACYNTFIGNNLQGNAGDVGLIFAATTGANTLLGNQNVVVDNGNVDCTGDGLADPNIITGRRAVRHGVAVGEIVSDAVVSSNRLR